MRRSRQGARSRWAVVAASALLITSGCGESSPGPAEHEPRGGPVPEETDGAGGAPAEETVSVPDVADDPAGTAGPPDVSVAGTVATGLHTPWDVDFLPDGSALVSLRDEGQVLRIEDSQQVTLDAGGQGGAVPDVVHQSEDGLLGLTVGPDQSIYLYLSTDSDNRVVRYDLEDETLVDPQVVLEGIPTHQNHVGGRVAFGPDGYLYVTTGDSRNLDLPQDPASLAGKILRVTADGDPAPGNPFDNEVWSIGHRNVQGLGWTGDGRMYASEFGSSDFDELNLIEPGQNYGWPDIEGWSGEPGFTDPLVTWTPAEASPSGIAVTDEGVWMTALRGERLWFVPLGPEGEVGEPREHQLGLGRLRAIAQAPDGSLWLVTSNTDGRGDPGELDDQIVRLEIS